MASSPIVYPAGPWINQDLVLFHGTIDAFAPAIVTGPILVGLGRTRTDFGPGFYTTTLLRQAHTWAEEIAVRKSTSAAVVEIVVAREDLAVLQSLAFVRGDFHADDYWSLVHHCRKGARDHGRAAPNQHYDVVYGPVAAFWNQRMVVADGDQIGFHTLAAQAVLNKSKRKRII